MKIWKYKLDLTDLQTVEMPNGAQILSAQVQMDDLCLWALVDPTAKTRARIIEIIGTGNQIEDANSFHRRFIDTVQLAGGHLVFHVFERV